MRGTNALAKAFNWLGEAFETMGPAAFRFLAAVLPYATPYPVAKLTSQSAVRFLNFDKYTSFVLVFGLEGIGLWFTSLLVDSVVEAIRSKSIRAWIMVLLFAMAIGSYITILVNLNVTLETTLENPNPALSKVITLLCFLPLLTGIGNGYYKLQLSFQAKNQEALEYQRVVEKEDKERASKERLEKARIKSGSSINTSRTTSETKEDFRNSNGTSKSSSGNIGRPSIHQERVFSFMEQYYTQTNQVASFTEVMKALELPQSTASRLRDKWIESRGGS